MKEICEQLWFKSFLWDGMDGGGRQDLNCNNIAKYFCFAALYLTLATEPP